MSQDNAIKIIQAQREHVSLVAPLFDAYRQFYKQQTDIEGAKAFLTQRLQEGSSVIFLALAEGDEGKQVPCGFTQLYPSFSSTAMQRIWILNDLFVAPETRKRGVGTALLERARAFAIDTQAYKLTLRTAVDNYTAQAVYEAAGWKRDEQFLTYDLVAKHGA